MESKATPNFPFRLQSERKVRGEGAFFFLSTSPALRHATSRGTQRGQRGARRNVGEPGVALGRIGTTMLRECKSLFVATLLCMVATYSRASLADNPIVQTNYTSDPAPMVSDGTVYLVTTHDENTAGQPCSAVAGYTLCQLYTFSSTDMVNWTDHGVVAKWSTFSWAATAAWAPQAIPRNGKFYLYVPLN